MLSKIEDILLRDRKGRGSFQGTLFECLDDGTSLLRLRRVSRTLYDLLDHHSRRLFCQLYIHSAALSAKERMTLASIAPFCQHLTITVSDSTVASTDMSERTHLQAKSWCDLLRRCTNVSCLTLRVHGDVRWPGYTGVEAELVSVRIAIEHAKFTRLLTLNLMPVHAMGIIHLQWNTLHSFGESRATSSATVWERIETLDLRINHASDLSEQRQIVFKKLLYSYLNSFAPTLRCLHLTWLDGKGPSPFTLHLEAGLEDRHAIQWQVLEEAWLGSITSPHRTLRLIPVVAPSMALFKMLRSTHRESWAVDPSDSSAWMDVVLGSSQLLTDDVFDSMSSVYSRQSTRDSSAWDGGISRSSMEVPFVLDL